MLGTVDFGLTFPKTLSTATLTFQINFIDLHLGVPGPPIEHPDTELTRTITRDEQLHVPGGDDDHGADDDDDHDHSHDAAADQRPRSAAGRPRHRAAVHLRRSVHRRDVRT